MSRKKLWFGIPETRMQWVPAPLAGAQASNVGFADIMEFENGGADIQRSAGYRKVYDFEFSAPVKGGEELSVFNKFASGFYGDGLICFADPYAFETNLFPAHWASPGLIEQGWPNIYTVAPTFGNTSANSYNQPIRTATFDTSTGATTPQAGEAYSVKIPVPPGYTLHYGVSAVSTGAGRIYARTIAADGTLGTPVALTNLPLADPTRLNTTVSSASAVAVEFYIGSTSAAAGTVAITSMMAQLWATGTSPTLTGDHVPGDGHTGLMFSDAARVETYTYINPPRKALSTTLTEVGAWRKN